MAVHLQRRKCAHAADAARQVWLRIVAHRDHDRIVMQRFRCTLTWGHNSTLAPKVTSQPTRFRHETIALFADMLECPGDQRGAGAVSCMMMHMRLRLPKDIEHWGCTYYKLANYMTDTCMQ